jgi:hypothetical protein
MVDFPTDGNMHSCLRPDQPGRNDCVNTSQDKLILSTCKCFIFGQSAIKKLLETLMHLYSFLELYFFSKRKRDILMINATIWTYKYNDNFQ